MALYPVTQADLKLHVDNYPCTTDCPTSTLLSANILDMCHYAWFSVYILSD